MRKLKKAAFFFLAVAFLYGCGGGVDVTGLWQAMGASTGSTYGSTPTLVLQLQQSGTMVTGMAMENNVTVGQVLQGTLNGSVIMLMVNFTNSSSGTGQVMYNGSVTADGSMMVLTPNRSSTGTITPITFARRR